MKFKLIAFLMLAVCLVIGYVVVNNNSTPQPQQQTDDGLHLNQ